MRFFLAGVKVTFVIAIAAMLTVKNAASEPFIQWAVCRGGGQMEISFFSQKSSYDEIRVKFQKASVGASQQSPAPGECTFVDRPIAGFEGSELRYTVENVRSLRGTCRKAGCTVEIDGVVGDTFKFWGQLTRAMQSDRLFHVRVNRGDPQRFYVTEVALDGA